MNSKFIIFYLLNISFSLNLVNKVSTVDWSKWNRDNLNLALTFYTEKVKKNLESIVVVENQLKIDASIEHLLITKNEELKEKRRILMEQLIIYFIHLRRNISVITALQSQKANLDRDVRKNF